MLGLGAGALARAPDIALVLVGSAGGALLGTRLARVVAHRYGLLDRPDGGVKTHERATAYLGGLGMFVGVLVATVVGILVTPQPELPALAVLGGALLACLIGLLDDLFGLRPRSKLLGQLVASVVVFASGIRPVLHLAGDAVLGDFGVDCIGFVAVAVFVAASTNSLNLLDGLDGLCAGVTRVIALGLLVLTWRSGTDQHHRELVTTVCVSLIGATTGFLRYNRHPATIFMGDTGSLLLGFLVATVMLWLTVTTPRMLPCLLVGFGFPILDTSVTIAGRIRDRRPMFKADRGHFYDLLRERGISLTRTVRICQWLTAGYVGIAVAMSYLAIYRAIVAAGLVALTSAIVVIQQGFLRAVESPYTPAPASTRCDPASSSQVPR
jgi:UDP-GlcNAc:undecaprenyl-phosphate/decaprenyl-phosphate GlcNAc-1-phosphate transferase